MMERLLQMGSTLVGGATPYESSSITMLCNLVRWWTQPHLQPMIETTAQGSQQCLMLTEAVLCSKRHLSYS